MVTQNEINHTGSVASPVNEDVFKTLEQGVYAALETYSNVHRGSGLNSVVTTHLYEQARDIVLDYLGLNKRKYIVIFCTPWRESTLKAILKPGSFFSLSSADIGLPVGVRALAVLRKALPKGPPFQTGGGTTRLVSTDWIIWANGPDRFEAGTPSIVNIIAFCRALQMIRKYGNDLFLDLQTEIKQAKDILRHDDLEKFSGLELLDKLRQTLIGRHVLAPTLEGSMPYVNLDNGASTQTFMPVWDAVCRTWRQPAQVKQEIIHEARSVCAEFLGAPRDEYDVIFTSNTTEAINLIAGQLDYRSETGIEPVLISTLLEHSSNDIPWRMVPGTSLIRLTMDAEGFLDLKALDALLRDYNHKKLYGNKRIKLMAVTGASNVLGSMNDLKEISHIVHRYGVQLLVDAAQLVAHRKVDMVKSGIDYLAFSAHKVYAPFGCGVLVVRKGLINLQPEEKEMIRSSGEENAIGIAALGKALILLHRIDLDLIHHEEQVLTAYLLRGLAKIPGIRIHGLKDPESPRFDRKGGVVVFELKGLMANRIARELSEKGGIGVRYGCHCAHVLIKHILGLPPFLQQFQRLIVTVFTGLSLPGLVRVSTGIGNSTEDIDRLLVTLDKISGKATTSRRNGIPGNNSGLKPAVIKQQMNEFIRESSQKVYFRSI
jgi:selenocysteine lyase/cysteine desulfurase